MQLQSPAANNFGNTPQASVSPSAVPPTPFTSLGAEPVTMESQTEGSLIPDLLQQPAFRVGVVYDDLMERHCGPTDHVECPERTAALFAKLKSEGLMARCTKLEPRQATDEELLLAHTREHIETLEAACQPSPMDPYHEEGDMYYCRDTIAAARTAAGCCIQAVQAVIRGEVDRAMAVVRPPGHHALCDRAMGFCFFNNTALAALTALQEPGINKVLLLDWDVHHGNGIQEILYQNPNVLYVSLHRSPEHFYPYYSGFADEVGEGDGEGFNINIPWSKGMMADGDYEAAFHHIVEPVLEQFQPDLIIVSAGYDAAFGDPLGGCQLSPSGYAGMTQRLLQFAEGKLVLALEGGYNLRVTAECAAECVKALLGSVPARQEREKGGKCEPNTYDDLLCVMKQQEKHWSCLSAAAFKSAWLSMQLSHELGKLSTGSVEEEDVLVVTKPQPVGSTPASEGEASIVAQL